MLSSLKVAAEAAGKPEWGHSGPTDAGSYNNWPEDVPFFRREGGGWNCPYGDFFLTWYSQMLLNHGELILSAATTIFSSTNTVISVKVAGIHWHYGTRSHAPELTAGYYNTRFNNGYLPIARMLARHGAIFNFTCVEMKDWQQPAEAMCRPEALVRQVAEATREAGIGLAGENALPRYDEAAHEQILKTALRNDGDDERLKMVGFTYLRMGMDLFHPENWRKFATFVQRMADGCPQETLKKVDKAVHETRPWVQEALMMSK